MESKPSTFYFSLSPFFAGFRWIALLGISASLAMALVDWFRRHNPDYLISFFVQLAVLLLLWRRAFRPLPSSVSLDGDNLVFKDVPSFWVQIQWVSIPIIIRREIKIPIALMVPEWIDDTLTWNDMERGRTVYLARGEQASQLVNWLTSNGVAHPVGK